MSKYSRPKDPIFPVSQKIIHLSCAHFADGVYYGPINHIISLKTWFSSIQLAKVFTRLRLATAPLSNVCTSVNREIKRIGFWECALVIPTSVTVLRRFGIRTRIEDFFFHSIKDDFLAGQIVAKGASHLHPFRSNSVNFKPVGIIIEDVIR